MNRDEYLAMVETEPATPSQRGAIMRETERLGFHYLRDRMERLSILARLLGLDELTSTTALTQGQAGYLVNLLRRIRDRDELADVTAAAGTEDHLEDDGQGQDDDDHLDQDDQDHLGQDGRVPLADAIDHFVLMVALAALRKANP